MSYKQFSSKQDSIAAAQAPARADPAAAPKKAAPAATPAKPAKPKA